MAVGFVSADIDSTKSKTLAGTGTDRLVLIADSGTSAAVRTLLSLTLNGVSGVTLETVGVDGGTAIMNGLAHIDDTNDPGAGTFTIADTWSGSAPAGDVYASIELSGVDQTTPRETVISNSTTALADGGTIDVTVAGYSGEFALCFICTNGGGAGGGHTLPTGFTSIAEVLSGTNRTHWGYISSIGSASEVYTFTASGDGTNTMQSVSAGVIVINAASSGLSITPTGLSSAEAFGTAVIGRGAVSITPNGIASAEAFGTAVLSSLYTIAANAIATAEAFGTAVFSTGAVSVLPSGIATAEAVGAAVLSNGFVILPLSIESLEALGNPVLTVGNVTILPAGIASSETIGAAIVGDVIIVADIAFINDLVQELVKDITGGLNG